MSDVQTCPRKGVIGRNDMSTRTHASFLAARRFPAGQSVFVQFADGIVPRGLQLKYTLATAPNGATIRLAAAVMSAWRLFVTPVSVAGHTWAPGFADVIRPAPATQLGSALLVTAIHLASVAANRAPSRAA